MDDRLTADADVSARLLLVEQAVTRLTDLVAGRLAPPVDSLTAREAAARIRCSTKKIYSLLALGVFTQARGGGGRGCGHRVLADEVDVYRLEGEEACRRYRAHLGRGG